MPWSNSRPNDLDRSVSNMTLGIFGIIVFVMFCYAPSRSYLLRAVRIMTSLLFIMPFFVLVCNSCSHNDVIFTRYEDSSNLRSLK